MKSRIHLFPLTATMLAIAVSPLRAQVVADGATNTLNGGTTTIVGDVTVGTNGSFTLLVLTNNALLTNSGYSYIGRNVGANSNAVWLTDANTRWLMNRNNSNTANLLIGSNGAFNRLVISNGALVGNDFGNLGYKPTSSNNEAVVTGWGSFWSNRHDLTVGTFGGSGNRLEISNGGQAGDNYGVIGLDTCSNNEAVVTGTGSFWSNRVDLWVGGFDSSGNRLVISNGGTVFAGGGVSVGTFSDAVNNLMLLSTSALLTNVFDGVLGANPGANSNTAFLSDLNTRWLMGGNLHVGSNAAFNRLVISNGAFVRNDYGYLGDTASSSNNMALVTGTGSVWSNRLGLHVGNSGSGNRLVITNGGVVRNLNGLLGLNADSSNNTALVTGAGSSWTNEATLSVGFGGAGNQLVVSNGGAVLNSAGYVGGNSDSSSDNVATVTGAGSLWSSLQSLFVGYASSLNRLVIGNGGVAASFSGIVGFDVGAISNLVLVTGASSQWSNNNALTVGHFGSFNQLVISNGGVVRNSDGFVGNSDYSSNNLAVVTGAGSQWMTESELYVGYGGAGNQLVVTNGGVVRAGASVTLGNDVGATNNSVLAMGGSLASVGLTLGNAASRNNSVTLLSNSIWNVGGGTFIWGDAGFNNTLNIDPSSALTNIGALTLDENDTAFYLTNAPGGYTLNGFTTNQLQYKSTGLGALVVGNDGTNVQLTISDYTLAGTTGTIGDSGTARSNLVLVTGAGSLWSNSATLKIGNNGSLNKLAINNGGAVASPSGTLGFNSGADFNLVLVTGPNSRWNNSGPLTNGGGGAFNQLVLSDGGVVASTTGTVGSRSTANSNSTLVTGTGSLWTNSSDLFIGESGSFNQLVLSNSGVVASTTGTVGRTGSNNLALISGTGSLWTNSSYLLIGEFGSFNQLVLKNGGVVADTTGIIGYRSTANSNSTLVTGTGSLWTNSSDLYIGRDGAFNRLVISNGSKVVNAVAHMGSSAGANSNSVLVSGAGSVWSNRDDLLIGGFGAFNQLVLSNGGVVRNTTGTVGTYGGANSNSVEVTGAGSLWSNNGTLLLGGGGASNRLVISDGGSVANTDGTVASIVGRNGNSVLVTGAGSLWTNNGSLTLGSAGALNQLVLSNGAAVRAIGAVTLGGFAGATNNSVLAVGGSLASAGLTLGNAVSRNNSVMLLSNSTWNVGGGTFIWGNAGFNDTLVIDTTSALTNIGALTLDENNTAFFLTNAPGGYTLNGFTASQFQFKPTGLGAVIVGKSGTNVQLTISRYTLADTTGSVGNNATALSNSVFVTGSGSVWSNSSDLLVGGGGAFNRLVVNDGGVVRNTSGTVGANAGANSNSVMVTGAGSLWSNSSDLLLGGGGAFNRLVVSDGGVVRNASATVANLAGRNGNSVLVTGAGSLWNNSSSLVLGSSGAFNQLVISDGGVVTNTSGTVGGNPGANSNSVVVTGAGSVWSNSSSLTLGSGGAFNQLIITNGALVGNSIGYLGFNSSSGTNEAVVTGPGSLWNNRSDLYVGNSGIGNRLVITNGGTVFASNAIYLGFNSTSSNNLLTVGGGSLLVTNPAGSGVLDIRRGTSVLNSGLMTADRLLLTNSQGFFTFNGGTLRTKVTTKNNGQLFTVGNGTSPATFELAGNGLHTFSSGVAIANNALLRGNGTIGGTLTVAIGGTLSPGTSFGKIVLNSPPVLLGNAIMEISRNGAVFTNDQVQVAGTLTYGGSLTVSNLGPSALTAGNSFQLFSASDYDGTFSPLSLPALDAGLVWTNKLLMNGSIEVIGVTLPKFATITLAGTNVIIAGTNGTPNAPYAVLTSTNVALPLINWTSIATNQFGPGGEFSFTNGIVAGIPQLFYRIRTP